MSLRIEPLSRHHDRNGFNCGDEAVDRFLQQKAKQDQDLDLGRSCVLVDPEKDAAGILGYHSLTMLQVPQNQIPHDRPIIKRGIPVILLGQVGVDIKCQRKGYGDLLLSDAQGRVLEISNIVGIRALVLDARSRSLVEWYSSYGFLQLADSMRMVKRIEAIRQELVD